MITSIADILEDISGPVELDSADRKKIAGFLLAWFDEVPKRLDLPQDQIVSKLESFKRSLEELAANVQLKLSGAGVTAEAAGDSAVTLMLVQRGSLWFSAYSDVASGMLAATSQDS
jgi:hypothetical protein